MRNTDGVEAVFFQDADAAKLALPIFARAQHAVIVVDAAAAQLYRPAIHGKTVLCVPFQFPNAEAHTAFVRSDLCHAAIKVRRFRAPELCVWNDQLTRLARYDKRFAVINLNHLRISIDRNHGWIDRNGVDTQLLDIFLIPNQQRHRAIDAAAGVPTAVRLQVVVHAYRDGVFTRLYEIRNVHIERREPVAVTTRVPSVHRNGAVLIRAFEMQHERFADICLID